MVFSVCVCDVRLFCITASQKIDLRINYIYISAATNDAHDTGRHALWVALAEWEFLSRPIFWFTGNVCAFNHKLNGDKTLEWFVVISIQFFFLSHSVFRSRISVVLAHRPIVAASNYHWCAILFIGAFMTLQDRSEELMKDRPEKKKELMKIEFNHKKVISHRRLDYRVRKHVIRRVCSRYTQYTFSTIYIFFEGAALNTRRETKIKNKSDFLLFL